jgi:Mg2+/Co2+ transporter CorB
MIPLTVFLLACAAVYLGTIDAAFSALMRLSLRLLAERSARPGSLGEYLDDPVLLFAPVRLLLLVVTAFATVLLARGIGLYGPQPLATVLVSVSLFIAIFQVVLPRILVIGDPERVLEALLPSFRPIARVLRPIATWRERGVPRIGARVTYGYEVTIEP